MTYALNVYEVSRDVRYPAKISQGTCARDKSADTRERRDRQSYVRKVKKRRSAECLGGTYIFRRQTARRVIPLCASGATVLFGKSE